MTISQLVLNAYETLGKRFLLKSVSPNIIYDTKKQDGWKYKVIPYDTDTDAITVKISSNNEKPLIERKDNEIVFVSFENLQAKPYIKSAKVDDRNNTFVDIELSITATNIIPLRATKE